MDPIRHPTHGAAIPPGRDTGRGSPPPAYDSRDLLAGRDEVRIDHGATSYRLRQTRQGKLILTK